MKSTFVRDLVAKVERQALVVIGCRNFFLNTLGLETHGALAEPEMLSHPLDEQDFGWSGGSMLGAESVVELVKFFLAFPAGIMKRPARPWRKLFIEEREIPALVFGPVEC